MPKTLVVVESPAKAKKIGSFLGREFTVKASVGHIRDLPRKSLGVDLESLAPSYEINEDKKATVAELRKLTRSHDRVIIATDPDREGESIGWHIKAALGLSDNQYERVAYGEITETAIRKAMRSPRKLDMDRVSAQEARRVLDRLIGYLVSPALSDQAGKTLSAGRVQSVAVRLVVDREREIDKFTPETFYSVTLTLDAYPEVKADLALKPWAKDEKHLWTTEEADRFCGPQEVTLVDQQSKKVAIKPRPPLTTVTMQGLVGKLFGMTASEVMAAAQKLFDNGHITYHRTDNPNLSDEGYELIVDHLKYENMPFNSVRPEYAAKADAQEAHEAIRPTDIARKQAGDTEAERNVYALIRERAMCMAMPPGEDLRTQMVFASSKRYADLAGTARPAHYVAKGRVIQSSGWREYATLEPVSENDTPLPKLDIKRQYDGTVKREQKETKPPSRYTEHTLIKKLEAAGIGRPSTYAAILENVKGRGYIGPDKKSGKKKADTYLVPGADGVYVVGALINMAFMGYRYTQEVEKALDEIAKGNKGYINIVRPMYTQLSADIEQRLDAYSLVEVRDCPQCKNPVIQKSKKRKGRVNTFWVHKNADHAEACGVTFLDDQGGSPALPEPEVSADCPICQQMLIRKTNDRGAYWVHKTREHGDKCGTRFFPDNNGPQMPEKPKTAPCAACGDTLTRRYSKKTEKHLWVHSKDKPSCGSFFVDDEDGVPAISVEG